MCPLYNLAAVFYRGKTELVVVAVQGALLCLLRLDVGSCRESARHRHHMITLLFGLVWPRTKCGNHHPKAVTTVVAPGVPELHQV